MQTFAAFDRIWLNSRALEHEAYNQLSAFDSDLGVRGRNLCTEVERALHRPVFYYLLSYYVPNPASLAERCPRCNSSWRASSTAKSGIGSFEFCCDTCRLITDAGVDTSRLVDAESD